MALFKEVRKVCRYKRLVELHLDGSPQMYDKSRRQLAMFHMVRDSEGSKEPEQIGIEPRGTKNVAVDATVGDMNYKDVMVRAKEDEEHYTFSRNRSASFPWLWKDSPPSTVLNTLNQGVIPEQLPGVPGGVFNNVTTLTGFKYPNGFDRAGNTTQRRYLSTNNTSGATRTDKGVGMAILQEKMEELIQSKLKQLTNLRVKYGNQKIGDITVSQVLGGMRDMIAMNCETSQLDPNHGITYRGLTINEMLEALPSPNPGSKCPYAESVLWLLLTGQVPTESEVIAFSRCIAERANVPPHVYKAIDQLPCETHPMTQYIVAISAMQTESVFQAAYRKKQYVKDEAWRLVLDDALQLIAKNALLLGYIYRRSFVDKNIRDGVGMVYDEKEDYGANIARLIGIDTPEFKDMMRLYIAVHADHEGGNVSSHAALVIGSALSDPYLAFTGAMSGLSGPLHGLANQECLGWVKNMVKALEGQEITVETVSKFAQETLRNGQVIPGYGHAVLRVVDPRHTAFVEFAHRRFPDDPLVKVLDICLEAIPTVLAATGKVKSPNANVDCSTGILLSHFGITDLDMYTVFFGVSRALGIMSQLVWTRALRMPIERPKSHTLDHLEEMCKQKIV